MKISLNLGLGRKRNMPWRVRQVTSTRPPQPSGMMRWAGQVPCKPVELTPGRSRHRLGTWLLGRAIAALEAL